MKFGCDTTLRFVISFHLRVVIVVFHGAAAAAISMQMKHDDKISVSFPVSVRTFVSPRNIEHEMTDARCFSFHLQRNWPTFLHGLLINE